MGVKQLCSVWLILLANIMLQVHAFVPHHHHNGQVCFDGYSVNITIPNDGNDARNNPAHPTDEDAECCALKHNYLIPDDGFEYKPAVTNIHHGFNIAGGFITSCASIPSAPPWPRWARRPAVGRWWGTTPPSAWRRSTGPLRRATPRRERRQR